MAQGGPGFTIVGTFNRWAGQCLAWVQDQAGLTNDKGPDFATALKGYYTYLSRGAGIASNEVQAGDFVFYGGTPANKGAGHTGIVNEDLKTYTSILSNGDKVIADISNGFGATLLGYVSRAKAGASTIIKPIPAPDETPIETPIQTPIETPVQTPIGIGPIKFDNPLDWARASIARLVWFIVGAIFFILGVYLLAREPAVKLMSSPEVKTIAAASGGGAGVAA